MFDAALNPRRRSVLLAVAGVPFLLTACAKSSGDAGGSGSDGGGDGSTLSIGTTDKVTALDPAGAYDNGSFAVASQVYSFLLSTELGSKDGIPKPDLAESAEFTSDTEYTVTLKSGLKFANGNPLTSKDVKHSFDRQLAIADPNGPSSLLENLDSVDATDDLTVVFHLKGKDQTFPYMLGGPAGPIVDATVFPADALLGDDEIVKANPFLGPYTLASYKLNELISYAANPDYDGIFGAPKTKSVSVKYYADSNNMKLDIQQGNIDAAYRSLSATDIVSLREDSKVTVHEGVGGEIRYIVFNFDTMPFGAKTAEADAAKARAVRQAAADLIDREAISKDVYKETYTPLWGYIPDAVPGSGTQFKTEYGDGQGKPDAARAAKRLSDAGVTTPVKLSLQYNPDHYGKSSGDEYAAVKAQLEKDGLFAVDLQSTEWVQYSKDRTSDVYPAYQLGWFPDFPDADNYLAPFFTTGNFLKNHYDNPEIDTLIGQERAADTQEQREAIFGQIQDIVSAEVSTIPLLQGTQTLVGVADLEGVTLDSSFKLRLTPLHK
ncbi:ABC transporter substrate-binding protein [Brachybacterium sp. JHP9]|uniref:ABC transporter substrate-binding protein n=1 Tax=Brachybacterium equifaecis TaxID=2910770 RepID=A0ABT0QYG4_9MICO|nr:ABC transporter substrate-binding protein [Brachybacterium equifaecis]MCL6422213.1 ABC transporter substrate-binding protein [Brachybacterium equifaecis]